jgi:hypothetical protein
VILLKKGNKTYSILALFLFLDRAAQQSAAVAKTEKFLDILNSV